MLPGAALAINCPEVLTHPEVGRPQWVRPIAKPPLRQSAVPAAACAARRAGTTVRQAGADRVPAGAVYCVDFPLLPPHPVPNLRSRLSRARRSIKAAFAPRAAAPECRLNLAAYSGWLAAYYFTMVAVGTALARTLSLSGAATVTLKCLAMFFCAALLAERVLSREQRVPAPQERAALARWAALVTAIIGSSVRSAVSVIYAPDWPAQTPSGAEFAWTVVSQLPFWWLVDFAIMQIALSETLARSAFAASLRRSR
jgi:hypothetical protein